MLSISPLSNGPDYYLELTSLNYYAAGGEPPPLWAGTAAKEFGLSGVADKEHVYRLCAGFHHESGRALVRNAGEKGRNPGHDLTFSAPKSISVAWAMGSDELRKAIEKGQLSAVRQALAYLEGKAGFARLGAGGQDLTKCPLLFALFEHGTSRALDPQLHTHALLINLTMHADRENHFTAVDSTYMYHYKMAAGAIYRTALAHEMQKIGFSVKQRELGASIGFELEGIPEKLIEEFSKRRAEIEEQLNIRAGSLDAASPQFAEMVALETRRKKEVEKCRADLLAGWQEVGRSFGVDAAYLEMLLAPHHENTPEERRAKKDQVFADALKSISDQHAHFNEAHLTRAVAERAAGLLTVRDVRELVENELHSEKLIPLGTLQTERKNGALRQYVERKEMRFTTPENFRLERALLGNVEAVVRGARNETPRPLVERVIADTSRRGFTLAPEQADAVRYLTAGPSIRLLVGIAGSGKTTTLKTCLEVWRAEKPNRVIIGAAVAAKTKNRLRDELGGSVPCETLAKLLVLLDNGRLRLDANTVILLDEGGMVGTRQIARLVEHIRKVPGARLVVVGDAKQLQPVEAGGPFKYLEALLEKPAKLSTIRRQEEVWARDAVADFEQGRAEVAIGRYLQEGYFKLAESRPLAIAKIVELWKGCGGVENPEKVLLLASLNHEVMQINLQAQAARILAGEVDPEKKMLINSVFAHVGDRVQFLKPAKTHQVVNGDEATVLAVAPEKNRITLRLDDEREITLDLKRFSGDGLRLGYATTTHKAQGATVDHCLVLMGGPLTNGHMGYVQVSRARISTTLVCDKHTAGDPELSDLIRSLSRQDPKTLAHEVLRKATRLPDRGIAMEP